MKEELCNSFSYYRIREVIVPPSFGIYLQYKCSWYQSIRVILVLHIMPISPYNPHSDTVIFHECYKKWAV